MFLAFTGNLQPSLWPSPARLGSVVYCRQASAAFKFALHASAHDSPFSPVPTHLWTSLAATPSVLVYDREKSPYIPYKELHVVVSHIYPVDSDDFHCLGRSVGPLSLARQRVNNGLNSNSDPHLMSTVTYVTSPVTHLAPAT